MNCPACKNDLAEIMIDDIAFDICERGCGGIWFDKFEFQKVDEPHESAGEKLLGISKDPSVVVDHNEKYNCPKCENVIMVKHFYSVKKEVAVDECPSCGGFWLDYGELGQIRGLYASDEERQKAAKEYFENIFGEELKSMKKKGEEKHEKAKKIARMFRFICPSYYMPGKQDWGAF
jgi:Zn-finger nucleic acid-binding protein